MRKLQDQQAGHPFYCIFCGSETGSITAAGYCVPFVQHHQQHLQLALWQHRPSCRPPSAGWSAPLLLPAVPGPQCRHHISASQHKRQHISASQHLSTLIFSAAVKHGLSCATQSPCCQTLLSNHTKTHLVVTNTLSCQLVATKTPCCQITLRVPTQCLRGLRCNLLLLKRIMDLASIWLSFMISETCMMPFLGIQLGLPPE